MPASSLSKLALHLSRFANWQAQQAAHQGGNAFKSGLGGSSASSSLSGVGAGPGAGAGGAKFHAGRGAQFTYNSGSRAVVQAGSSGTGDGSSYLEDDEEHHNAFSSPHSRPPRSPHHRRDSSASQSRGLSLLEREATSKGIELNPLNRHALQRQFRQAFAAANAAEAKGDALSQTGSTGEAAAAATTSIPIFDPSGNSAEIHRDLVDANNRKDRIAVLALVEAYRQLPSSEKTTAGFNAALQAQVSVRESGESLRDVRETHKDMLDTGCQPNSNTSAILVKALCVRDQEKTADKAVPAVAVEAEASSEAWRIASTCPTGLQDASAYNALISRCAAKGDIDRALATYQMLQQSTIAQVSADTYLAILPCLAQVPEGIADVEDILTERLGKAKQCLQEAIKAMSAPTWINSQDSEIFQTYIETAFHLQAPDEAIDLFQRLISQESGLPKPAGHVTGALIYGFIEAGDFTTALTWIERIESLNSNSVSGATLVAAPDFEDLKKVVTQALHEIQQQEEEQQTINEKATAETQTSKSQRGEAAEDNTSSASLSSSDVDTPISSVGPHSLPSGSAQVLSQPPSLGEPEFRLVDCDLGERIQSMIRNRKTASSGPKSNNLENAFRLIMSEAAYGTYAPPEIFAQLLNAFGRDGKLHRVHELRRYAHVAIAGLVGAPDWQRSAFTEVEDKVISALAHGGDVEGAHAVRHAMLSTGSAPSANSYAALISSIRDSTDEAMLADQLWEESQRFHVRPNIYLVNTVISRLGRARRADKALQLYESLPQLGLKPTSITYGATLNCAVRVGDIQTAENIFQEMEADPSFVARPPGYNSMIQFFTYNQPDRQKALEYWGKMQARSVRPSSHTYKLLLDVHGTIEPVQPEAMNAIFSQLLRDRNVDVAGPHWASLIDCYGNHVGDLDKCLQIFRSIALKTGAKADAVAYEALLQVYARHGQVNLIDALIAEMIKCGVPRTAYIANQAIEGYSTHGGTEGLTKARTIFMAMSQPPAGIASIGNHPLPRHHGAGSGNGSAYFDRRSDMSWHSRQAALHTDVQEFLAQTSSHATDSSTMTLSLNERLAMLDMAFEVVHPEPSTYEKMIQLEMKNGHPENAKFVIQRMEERAFPAALVIKARNLLSPVSS